MANESRTVVGHLVATVKFPLYAGDRTAGSWNDFIYEEPGVKLVGENQADLAVCRRLCETVEVRVNMASSAGQ